MTNTASLIPLQNALSAARGEFYMRMTLIQLEIFLRIGVRHQDGEGKEITGSELTKEFGVSPTTVSSIVNNLSDHPKYGQFGVIYRTLPDPANRRLVGLRLTEKGESVFAEIIKALKP